jgi:hypothetical protein
MCVVYVQWMNEWTRGGVWAYSAAGGGFSLGSGWLAAGFVSVSSEVAVMR